MSDPLVLPKPRCHECDRPIPAVAVVDLNERHQADTDRRYWCTTECLADTWQKEGRT